MSRVLMTNTMKFVNPIMLSTLALIPVLIIIHTLKSRPKGAEVTNLYLWQEHQKKVKVFFHLFLRQHSPVPV